MTNNQEYIRSIDQRLQRIEVDVSDIKANLMGLKIKVASISAAIATLVTAGIKWFF